MGSEEPDTFVDACSSLVHARVVVAPAAIPRLNQGAKGGSRALGWVAMPQHHWRVWGVLYAGTPGTWCLWVRGQWGRGRLQAPQLAWALRQSATEGVRAKRCGRGCPSQSWRRRCRVTILQDSLCFSSWQTRGAKVAKKTLHALSTSPVIVYDARRFPMISRP